MRDNRTSAVQNEYRDIVQSDKLRIELRMAEAPFQYEPFSNPTKQIRVLTILSGNKSDPISCNLTTTNLRKGGHSCLSYCWGTEQATHTIRVNGSPYLVRPNLYAFLQTARDLEQYKPLWVDAVCINQTDSIEKSTQVELMGEIYSLAAKTFVWLGLPLEKLDELHDLRINMTIEVTMNALDFENDGDNTFQSCVRPFSRELNLAWKSLTSQKNFGEGAAGFFERYNDVLKLFSDARRLLLLIMDNTYWTRAWIIQELLLSPTAEFLTSYGHVSLEDFMSIFQIYDLINNIIQQQEQLGSRSGPCVPTDICEAFAFDSSMSPEHMRIQAFRRRLLDAQLHDPQNMTLDKALDMSWQAGCYDKRDRLFSIHSLLQPRQRVSVDYTIDHETLFSQVMNNITTSNTGGQELLSTGCRIFSALSLHPPSPHALQTTANLLEDIKATDSPSLKVSWARPPGHGGPITYDSRLVSYTARMQRVGCYIMVQLTSGDRAVLEYIVTSVKVPEPDVAQWNPQILRQPRAWIKHEHGNTWVLREGEAFGFNLAS